MGQRSTIVRGVSAGEIRVELIEANGGNSESGPYVVSAYRAELFRQAKALRMVGCRPVTLPRRPAYLLRPDRRLSRSFDRLPADPAVKSDKGAEPRCDEQRDADE